MFSFVFSSRVTNSRSGTGPCLDFVENFCNPSVDALHLTTIILNCDSPQATQARRLWLLRASTVCSNFWHDANSRPPFEWVPMAALESLASLNALSNWSSHRNQSSSNRFLWFNFIHAYVSITYIIPCELDHHFVVCVTADQSNTVAITEARLKSTLLCHRTSFTATGSSVKFWNPMAYHKFPH